MTKATQTLAIIFAALLLISAGNYFFSGKSQSKAFSSKIVEFDSTSVNKLIIYRPDKDAIEVSKQDGTWKVKSGENMYDADPTAVTQAMNSALDLKIKSLATRKQEKFTRFQVDDSSGTKVNFQNGDKVLSSLIVGKFNFVSQTEFNTYVRATDSDEVFAVEGFVGSSYNKDIDAWRNKKVWSFKDSEVSEVAVTMPADSSFTLTRVGANDWMSGVDTLKGGVSAQILRNVARLNAVGFIENKDVTSFGEAPYSVKVTLDNGSTKSVRLYPNPDDKSKFIATAADFPYVFTLNKSTWKSSVFKDRTKFSE